MVQAFVEEGAKRAFGPTLHIEGDFLFFDGWWQAAMRVSLDTFAVRAEEPPADTDVVEQMDTALEAKGLENQGTDFPLVGAITYTEIALPPVAWSVWSPSAARAEEALGDRAGRDAFLGDETSPIPVDVDYGAELGGARRLSGLPPAVVLTLGVAPASTDVLEPLLPECRFESRPLDATSPDVCNSLMPSLMLVDATADTGRNFIMELRAAACGRTVPVLALTPDGTPAGADAAVDPGTEPTSWVEPIRNLLP